MLCFCLKKNIQTSIFVKNFIMCTGFFRGDCDLNCSKVKAQQPKPTTSSFFSLFFSFCVMNPRYIYSLSPLAAPWSRRTRELREPISNTSRACICMISTRVSESLTKFTTINPTLVDLTTLLAASSCHAVKQGKLR